MVLQVLLSKCRLNICLKIESSVEYFCCLFLLVFRTLCGIILSLCLVGTVLDILSSFFKPRPSTVNNTEGYMPIENGSIAIDNDQAPLHVPAFAEHDGISDNSQMIHSYQEGTGVPECSPLTSSPKQPKEPSKFWVLSDNFFKTDSCLLHLVLLFILQPVQAGQLNIAQWGHLWPSSITSNFHLGIQQPVPWQIISEIGL